MAKTLIPGLTGQPRVTRAEWHAFSRVGESRRRSPSSFPWPRSICAWSSCHSQHLRRLLSVLTVPCDVVIGLLFIVGHDACLSSFTASTRLNQTIGQVAFLPALHPFSLWDLACNRTHQRI